MDREMLRFNVQIRNAKVRLERGIQGAFGEEADAEAPRTPARNCCMVNLRKMRGAVGELGVIFDEMAACHEADGNPGAISTVRIAQNDLAAFARGVEALAEAPRDEQALGILRGLTRAYITLLDTTEKIEPCARENGSPDPAAAESPKKKKKDRPAKRKKKKADDEGDG